MVKKEYICIYIENSSIQNMYCVLDCEDGDVWQGSAELLFVNKLKYQSDSWIVINISRGESVPDPSLYDGIVITGSHCNVRDGPSLSWFEPLCDLIRSCYASGSTRLYGGCFGCQVIAHALEGIVDYNPTKRFVCKAESVCLCESIDSTFLNPLHPYMSKLPPGSEGFSVISSHGDCVEVLPRGAVLLASSSSCTNEIYMVGKDPLNRNILGIQTHPEFDVEYAIWERIWPLAVVKNKRLSEEERLAYEPGLHRYDRTEGADALISFISDFLHVQPEPRCQSYCVLDCENSKVWDPVSFDDMFVTRLKADGECWRVINISKGELVSDPSLYDGIVITGSHCNIRDGPKLPWFEPLCDLVRACYASGSTRLYGGCFGCQVIAHALEGIVDYNPTKRFVCKAESVCICQSIDSELINPLHPYLSKLPSGSKGFSVISSHGDCVEMLPKDAVLLASSSSCTNQIYMVGKDPLNRNILGVQTHPEFDVEYAIWERIWPLAVVKNKRLSEEERLAYEPGLCRYERTEGADALISFIRDFLIKK